MPVAMTACTKEGFSLTAVPCILCLIMIAHL